MNLEDIIAGKAVIEAPAKKAPAAKKPTKKELAAQEALTQVMAEVEATPATPAAPAAKIDYAAACVAMAKNVANQYMTPATPADAGILAVQTDDATLELHAEHETQVTELRKIILDSDIENTALRNTLNESAVEIECLQESVTKLKSTSTFTDPEVIKNAVDAAVRENELMLMATIELLTSKITALHAANKALEEKVAATVAGEQTDISECCATRWNIFKNFYEAGNTISLARDESRLNTTEISELVKFGYIEATAYTQNNKPAARITKLLK
jgi:hypothetical protein